MTFSALISLIGSVSSLGLAVFVFLRDRHSLVNRIFAIGMVTFAIEAAITATSLQAILPSEIMYWQRARLVAAAFLPGVWLLFSLTFARVNYEVFLKRYRWVILAAFVLPISLVAFPGKSFFTGEPVLEVSAGLVIVLGWSGYAFFVFFLSFIVLILIHLENTLRASVGSMRWQVKFIVIGLGSILGIRIYTGSQAILFHYLNMTSWVLNSTALIVGNALIIKSLVRGRSLNVNFYLSHSFLFNSLTALIVGIYFLVVAVLARVVYYFSNDTSVHTIGLFFFFSILGVFVLILSDRFRQRLKRFIIINLRRPDYDYRKEWTEFTRATTSVMGMNDLCNAIVKKVSSTFDTLSVTLWLIDKKGEGLVLGGSTVFTDPQAESIMEGEKVWAELLNHMRQQQMPGDLYRLNNGWAKEIKETDHDYLKKFKIRYCVPLRASDNFLGFMTLDDRVAGTPLSVEDFDLLKTIGDQTAGILLNFKLSEHLRQLKETEAYQTMSAFIMHDLKNLASNLSLTMQNLPIHFNNPDFRDDALRMIQQSVTKLNSMCSRLSMLSQKIELKRTETDFNEMVASTLSSLNGCLKVSPNQDFQPVPSLFIDPGQIQKVLTNLILNANEAIGKEGEMRVTTGQGDSWVMLSVSDNGCGMEKEFLERSLFRPFKTTKKQGMGIGLYQSKMIVEAHQGRIEVESEVGKGSTFRVFLSTKKGIME